MPSTRIFLKVSNLSTTVEKSTLAQYAHPGKSERFKVFPPQYGVHTQGNFEKIKLFTPHHRAHTQGHFEKKQTLHTTPQSPHKGELFENFHSLYTQGENQEKMKVPSTGNFSWKINLSTTGALWSALQKITLFLFRSKLSEHFHLEISEFWRKFWKTASKIVRFFWVVSPSSFQKISRLR